MMAKDLAVPHLVLGGRNAFRTLFKCVHLAHV